MAWLFFVIATFCIALAFQTHSLGLAAVSLLAAFGLMLAGALKLASARINARTRNAASLIGPEEIALMRRAQAAAAASNARNDAADTDSVAQDHGGDMEPR